MQENTNWHWKKQPLRQNIIFTTRKILHPCLDVFGITDAQYRPKTVCNRIQEKSIQIHPIFLIDANYDYMLDEIKLREKN